MSSNVKWIKLSTQMFEDEKIRLIESMPEADTILIIWVKLLAQAGKTNASGYIYLAENIPFTDEMLATIFNRPLPTVRLALTTLERFGMIEINENQMICISNWEKHQNVQGLDKIREQTRQRVARHREQKKLEVTESVTEEVTLHVTDKEEEKELDIDKEKEKNIIPYREIISYLNVKTSSSYKPASKKTKELINARWNEGFTLEDFKKVIDNKTAEWLNDSNMSQYLRPVTLFGTKFESYLNQKGVKGNATDPTSKRGPDLPF
ncbi:phage replisome organizer N-terminal domain-containing protein [Priestia aryabhattai]|uniref:phage replisome organizer N-terminal domain-containing protein n=1 Tax=Priestia aryabhattai TaxID=412384 RepID=UPI0039A32EA0